MLNGLARDPHHHLVCLNASSLSKKKKARWKACEDNSQVCPLASTRKNTHIHARTVKHVHTHRHIKYKTETIRLVSPLKI